MKMNYVSKRQLEAVVFLVVFFTLFGYLGSHMGTVNMLKTIMNTAHDLLMNTVFYIMGITVLTGAFGNLLIEFGVVRFLEVLLKPLMRPIFNLPGVASLAGLMTFFSDNPAIISLSNDKNFKKYFKTYELISLTNFGTAFGMGLVVIAYMASLGTETNENYFIPTMLGLVGAIVGGAVSTRLMQILIRKDVVELKELEGKGDENKIKFDSEEKLFVRILNSVLDGGKNGVSLGLAIIPGVLIISTLVMIFTFGPADPSLGYQGKAYEGVKLLPQIAEYFGWLFKFLFGFENAELIAFPITSLGAVGAALSLVKKFITEQLITGNEIAVFTAMGMCFSGYLSTHTAMLDALNFRHLTSRALIAHTAGGIVAGSVAHYLYVIFM